jgi:hypothetical protein
VPDATTKQHKILVGLSSNQCGQSSKFARHPGGFCTSPSGYPWISDSQVRRPTMSPRAGVYITKPGRWICSSGLTSARSPGSRSFLLHIRMCVCVYTRRIQPKEEESSVRSRRDRNSVVQFDSDLSEGASKSNPPVSPIHSSRFDLEA